MQTRMSMRCQRILQYNEVQGHIAGEIIKDGNGEREKGRGVGNGFTYALARFLAHETCLCVGNHRLI